MGLKIKVYKEGEERLLSRDDFRNGVFKRDKYRCVVCGAPAQDAHHIMERRLFDDGGYYLSNGASLCGHCHIKAESTLLTVEQIRTMIGLEIVTIPFHFYPDEIYDKWGNIVLPTLERTKGELFSDESVQKILDPNVRFTSHVKYPRTLHLPWSDGATDDDRVHKSLDYFEGKEYVALEKMDGENTNLYFDFYHARSTSGASDPSQSWARNFHAKIRHGIPEGWRVCAENLYARHSVPYSNLKSFLYVYSIWDENNVALSWDETVEWAELLDMPTVKVLYRGVWDEKKIRALYDYKNYNEMEGYVVRPAGKFKFAEFRKCVGKFVRKGHVQTSHHWRQDWEPNKLLKN